MIPTVYASFMAPVLTLAAAMFTLTALNRQNEVTPLKAAGVSIYRVLAPIFILAAMLAAFTFYLQEKVIPRFKDPIRTALAVARARPLNPPPYFDTENGYLIRVKEYSTTRKIAHGVEITERFSNGKAMRQIDANQMEWAPETGKSGEDGTWVLHDGSIQQWDELGNLVVNASASKFERLKTFFRRMELKSCMRPIDLETSDLDISYLSSKDLKTQYQRQPEHRHLAVKLHHHFAFPFSHIILLFLGLPFVLHFENRSVFLGLLSCLGICALFFLVSSISMNIANHSEFFSPILAAWLPVMLFGSLGITLFDHLPS
jgi:lipopolysaccharide export LptBFGC system permease protein LptF